jgi:DNA-binding HxlR family transcriptional regulator
MIFPKRSLMKRSDFTFTPFTHTAVDQMSAGESSQPRRISFSSKSALPQKLRDTPNSAWQQSSPRAAALAQSAPQAKKRTSTIARVGHALWNDSSSSEPADVHAAERDMFDEIMGPTRHRSVVASTTNLTEAATAAVAAARPTAGGELDRALADKLAKRNCSLLSSVKQLEQEAKQHKRDIAAALETKRELMQQLDAASGGSAEAMLVQQLKVLAENERLRRQVQEMETFLSDYGLIWVGPTPEDCAEAGGSQLQGDACRSLQPQAGPGVDLDLLLCKMAELNRVVEEERGVIVTRNKRAQFRRPEVVPLRVFADGIAVGAGGALRPYADADLQQFMRDILDGYFPSEFRSGYPDGFVILAEDRRRESGLQAGAKLTPFSGDGQRLGSSSGSRSSGSSSGGYVTAIGAAVLDTVPVFEFRAAASALNSDDVQSVSTSSDSSSEASVSSAAVAPADSYVSVVVAETAVTLQLREAAASAATANTDAAATDSTTTTTTAAAAAAADVATIQVRSPDTGQTLLVKLLTIDTVGDLKAVVARHLATDGLQFEMRTAFPSRAHRDVGQTLAEAGLAPGATVMLRRVVQLASPRQL